MAWWNQPEGSVTPTVTLRRLAVWLAEHGHSYDIDLSEGLVRSSMAGLDHVFMVVDRRILAVRAHHQLSSSLPGAAELSRVRAVAQEVSSGRLIPALYTEVDDTGLGLCAEALSNIGAGLDDAQLAGTMDFILEGIDSALHEVIALLDARAVNQSDAGADVAPDAEPDTGVASDGSDGVMIAPVDADGGTGVETTDTPEPLLVS